MSTLQIIGARHAMWLTCVSELLPQPHCCVTVTTVLANEFAYIHCIHVAISLRQVQFFQNLSLTVFAYKTVNYILSHEYISMVVLA